MKTVLKFATAAAVTGALALASVTPSEARSGRTLGAAAIGFGAGALVGAAVAGNRGYYYGEPGYAYHGGYGYRSSPYAYRSGPYAYETYAYEPAYAEPGYVEPATRYHYRGSRSGSGSSCGMSPASPNYTSCN